MKIVNTRLTKIFIAIFAPDERLPSSATLLASQDLPKVDIFLNPNEQDRVENISAMKRGIAKNYFDNADATKLYPKLFEILWESTLPCLPGRRSHFSSGLRDASLSILQFFNIVQKMGGHGGWRRSNLC